MRGRRGLRHRHDGGACGKRTHEPGNDAARQRAHGGPLAVRIVTDNIVIQFVPNEKRDGLTIERPSGNTHPDRPPRAALNGEWGLAMHAQSSAAVRRATS